MSAGGAGRGAGRPVLVACRRLPQAFLKGRTCVPKSQDQKQVLHHSVPRVGGCALLGVPAQLGPSVPAERDNHRPRPSVGGLGVVSAQRCPGSGVPRPASVPTPASGWLYGERLRDGETGWFPEDFARSITSRMAVEGNVRRMERLRVETDV